MGSVDMLDAGDDLSAATPRASSSSGGASPWGSADKSSSSSLLSDATAFQVRVQTARSHATYYTISQIAFVVDSTH